MPKKTNNDWLKKLLNPTSVNPPEKDLFKPKKEDKRSIGKKIESLLISNKGVKML